MRHLLTLAAAAVLAVGCAGNKQDETGAAPDQGPDATVTATDTTAATPTDSTMGQTSSDSSFVQQDTTAADATMSTDSVGAQGEVQTGDTTSTTEPSTDSTDASMPADSAGTSDMTSDSTAAQ